MIPPSANSAALETCLEMDEAPIVHPVWRCKSAYRHELLKLTAAIGVEVLIEMKSPGCKWLSLIKD